MSIEQLAGFINNDCANLRYYWAYGLISETAAIWNSNGNKHLLCDNAQVMLECVNEEIPTHATSES